MKTFDLESAAEFLYASTDTVRELAASGEIPAAKVGRAWVFVDIDLIEWLRSQYAKSKDKQCHSISAAIPGTYTSHTVAGKLDKLLERKTERKRRKSMTSLKLV